MITYTIDSENSITALGAEQEGGDDESFSSQQELAKLVAEWPAKRLIEIWNGIPGLTPVNKFTDRKSAISRIWKAIQSLGSAEAASAALRPGTKAKAPVKPKSATTSAKVKPAKVAKGKRAKAGGKTTARDGSKKAEVLSLLHQNGGATLTEIMTATGWQAHSVRGFISGALGKKMGIQVDSVRREDGERVYSIA